MICVALSLIWGFAGKLKRRIGARLLICSSLSLPLTTCVFRWGILARTFGTRDLTAAFIQCRKAVQSLGDLDKARINHSCQAISARLHTGERAASKSTIFDQDGRVGCRRTVLPSSSSRFSLPRRRSSALLKNSASIWKALSGPGL